jgi:hypothetical protein
MKVTVKPKKVEKKEVPFNEIPVGSVYRIKYHNGPIALKLIYNEVVLLKYNDNEEWFEIAKALRCKPAYEVLGKLTEIIVEEV